MGLPRSTYYDTPATEADTEIVARITAICEEFEAYGYRRVGAELRDPVFVHAAARGRDEERRRRTLYEMVVEAKARRRGDYGEHQAMLVNFLCRRQRRSTWFGGRIYPAHRFKVNDVKRETAS